MNIRYKRKFGKGKLTRLRAYGRQSGINFHAAQLLLLEFTKNHRWDFIMEVETDLKAIEKMAKEKEEKNWKFRGFLKQLDIEIEELDSIVHRINDEVSAQIDCTECGNCCKYVKPTLDKDDVSKFASGLKISIGEFREKYLTQDTDDPSKYTFNALLCPFLENNMCSNYECRPKVCASYPHLHKDEFVFRLWGVVDNYSICLIVFNVYERLKSELWHNDYFYEADLLDFD